MPKPEKIALVEAIAEKLESANSMVLCDFTGVNVEEISILRKRCRESGVTFRVIKNTLLSRAAEKIGIDGLGEYFVGPTALAYSEDYSKPAKVLKEFHKEFHKLTMKAGYVDGQVIDEAGVKALADMPGREELLGMVAGVLQAPISGFARVLNANIQGFANVIDQLAKQKGEAV
jgi:large subunit ribosomal protein L10